MDPRSDKRQNTPNQRGSSSMGQGEAQETGRREIESLSAFREHESPADTQCWFQVSRTAVYGPVRTVVWQGSAALPPPLCRLIVVSSAKSSGLNSFAELTTPAAPFRNGSIFIYGASTPPLRGGE